MSLNQLREDHSQQRRSVETDTLKRWPVSLPCRFYWQDQHHMGHVLDLSERGVFVITSFVIPEDSRVRLSFWPRETEELHLDIVVTHSGEYPYEGTDCPGMGGRFVKPQRSTLQILRQFLNQGVIQQKGCS